MPPQLHKIVNKNLYNQGTAKGANGVGGGANVPQMITCHVCGKNKPHESYSKTQLVKYKSTIYQPYAPGGRTKSQARTTCKQCTPGQTTELTCVVCGETGPLKAFAKTQRKNPDRARCRKCIRIQAATTHDLEVPDSDDFTSDEEEGDDLDFDTQQRIDQNSTLSKGWGSSTYATSNIGGRSSTAGGLTQESLQRASQSSGWDDGWESVNKKTKAPSAHETLTYGVSSTAGSTRNDDDDDDGWAEVGKKKTQTDASTVGTDEWKTTGYSAPRQENLRKGGWAKVEKIPRNKGNNGFDDFDDSPWLGDSGKGGSGGGWNDKKKDLEAEYETDPWARRYK